eukprot:gene919-10675_t
MLGVKSGVAKRPKEQFPAIFIWHSMNHRLELAVSDVVKPIDGFYALEKLFMPYMVFIPSIPSDTCLDSAKRATYNDIAKKLATKEFVEDVAVIKDCLGQISIIPQSLQKSDISIMEANRYLKYTINGLEKIKLSITEGKYSFDQTVGNDVVFKGVHLHNFESRSSYSLFNKPQFLQALIDNMKARMLNASDGQAFKELEVFVSERWPSDVNVPWLEGERLLVELCQRFTISNDGQGLIMAFRDYVSDPRKTPKSIENLIQGILYTIPISSTEAERGFSQMNLVCTLA